MTSSPAFPSMVLLPDRSTITSFPGVPVIVVFPEAPRITVTGGPEVMGVVTPPTVTVTPEPLTPLTTGLPLGLVATVPDVPAGKVTVAWPFGVRTLTMAPVMSATDALPQVRVTEPPAGMSSRNPPQAEIVLSVIAVMRTPMVGSGASSTVTSPLAMVPVVSG
jgi:hypothetical protein